MGLTNGGGGSWPRFGTARGALYRRERAQRSTGHSACCLVFKDRDYLADNICVSMLSAVMDWVQEQSGWPDAVGSKLGIRLPLYEQCHRDSLAFRGRMSLKRCDAAGICTSQRRVKAPPKQKLGRATLWIEVTGPPFRL